ncbi:MAG: hypothetical protein Q8K67_11265 [Geothrix sp.]|nr:hypothetical protein [Geothrix sp.]
METQAKWLRWAMQSLTARKLEDVRYNLQKFWESLSDAKGRAAKPQDWGDIMTLDAQSQWTLGNLYQNDQADMLKQLNNFMLARNVGVAMTGPILMSTAAKYFAAGTTEIRSKIENLGASASAAFKAQSNLASQAEAEYRKAGIQDNQARSTGQVASYAVTGAPLETKNNLRQASTIAKPPEIPNPFSLDFLGFPLWAWIAGAAGIALLVATGPTVVMASNAYRKATA